MKLFLVGKSGLEADHSNKRGSPLEVSAVPDALTQGSKANTGIAQYTRPGAPTQSGEPAASAAQSQSTCGSSFPAGT